jgi:glycosyltransferase involved in cell wall biosynthesis
MSDVVYINGKFTAQATTGVQRVASQLLQALDARARDLPARCVLLCPPGGRLPALRWIECVVLGRRYEPLHLWEQCSLPLASRRGCLVNLAGSAPWWARTQVCLIHDAAVFDHPNAYAPAFSRWYRELFLRHARSGATLLTVSAFSRQRLAAALRIDASRIAVVSNGADHLHDIEPDVGVLRCLGLEGKRFLLVVATANPTKNLAGLLAAFAALPQPPDPQRSVSLVIVGGRNDRVFVREATQDALPGVIRAGVVDDASLKALYQHARALVFPSLYEGFGIPPLEAMACGCPVVAADVASIPEVCGDVALYMDPRSTPAMAKALVRILEDDRLVQRLRQAGPQHAAGYTWAASARALIGALPPRCVR